MSWFAEQAPPKDPPTEPRATQSHAAPVGGPSVAHQESSGHEEAPTGACFVCDHASGGGLRAAPGGGQAHTEHAAISRRPHMAHLGVVARAHERCAQLPHVAQGGGLQAQGGGQPARAAERPRRSSLLRASGGSQHRPRVRRACLPARAATAGARTLLPAKVPSA